MAERFRARFWVDEPDGGYPVLALDAAKRPVDALTSNIGHLLGTGLLTEQESARVAELLASPAMAGGFGLRTMSAEGRIQPALLPLRLGLGTRHRHRHRGPGPVRVRRSRRPAGRRPDRGR
jgi:hypothetical protein